MREIDDTDVYHCCDTDNVKYLVTGSRQKVILQFTAPNLEAIW